MSIFNKIKDVLGGGSLSHSAGDIRNALAKSGYSFKELDDKRILVTIPADAQMPVNWHVYIVAHDEAYTLQTVALIELEKEMKAVGIKTGYTKPATYADIDIPYSTVSNVKALGTSLEQAIGRFKAVFAASDTAKSRNEQAFDTKLFDRDYLRREIEKSQYYEKTDDDGDIRLTIPPSNRFMHELFAWVMLKPYRITIDSGVRGINMPDELEDAAKYMGPRFPSLKFKVEDNKLRIDMYVDPEKYPASEAEASAVEQVQIAIDTITQAWISCFEYMGLRTSADQFFNPDMVRTALKKNLYYKKTDEEGDMYFEIPGDEDFRPGRFVWVLPKHDHIIVTTGVDNFKKLSADMDFDKVCADYNSRSTGIEARVSSGTIRLRKRLQVDNYGATNPTDAVIADIDKAISEIMQQWKVVAGEVGIRTHYFVPTIDFIKGLLKKDSPIKASSTATNITLTYPEEKTTANDFLDQGTISFTFSAEAVDVKLKMRCYPIGNSDTARLAAKMSSELGSSFKSYNASDEYGVTATFFFRQFTSKEAFTQAVMYPVDSVMIDSYKELGSLPLDAMNADIRRKKEEAEHERRRREQERREREAEAERERQRQREEERQQREKEEQEEKAELEAELEKGFTITLSPDTTIRRIQEWFNEDFVYLRIGFYMVKTGQSADRDGGTITSYDEDMTLSQIRSFKGGGKIRIDGTDTPEQLEKAFRSQFGLVIKICYNNANDNRYYISKTNSEHKLPIGRLNKEFRERGYNRADIS